MGRASRAWTFFWETPESKREGLRQERSLLRTLSSSGDQTPRPWWRNLLTSVDNVCGLERAWLGAAGHLHNLGQPPSSDRVQADSEFERGDTTPLPVSASTQGSLSVTYLVSTGMQKSEGCSAKVCGRAGRLAWLPIGGSTHLALHRQLDPCATQHGRH